MKINNALEFSNFLKSHDLINMSPEANSILRCVDEFQRLCSCDPPAVKNAKLTQCKTLYINFTKRASQYKNILFSKVNDSVISFCLDGQVITHLTR